MGFRNSYVKQHGEELNRADRSFVWVFYILVSVGVMVVAALLLGFLIFLGILFEYICGGWPLVEVKESCVYLLDGTLACW